jgi:hypothetical protein
MSRHTFESTLLRDRSLADSDDDATGASTPAVPE